MPIEWRIEVTNFRLDFDVKTNSNLTAVFLVLRKWIKDYLPDEGQYLEMRLEDFTLFTANCYPSATESQLFALTKMMIWVFVFDDQVIEKFANYKEGSAYVEEMMKIWDRKNTQELDKAENAKFYPYLGILMSAYESLAGEFILFIPIHLICFSF